MSPPNLQSALAAAEQDLLLTSDAPRIDAERMLLHVLKRDEASWLTVHSEEELTKTQQEEFERLVDERATGKPLAYVLGQWEFYGRTFYVTPDVLVPRPETENLLDAALLYIDVWREKNPGEEMVIADLGTGSGIIAITLALKTQVKILATDISLAALQVATKNAQRHGVDKIIMFIQEDMATSLATRKIDLIVSNPPYVPTAELTQTSKRDTRGLDFEPKIALDGGPDGQNFIREIQASGIPAFVEGTGGGIRKFNFSHPL